MGKGNSIIILLVLILALSISAASAADAGLSLESDELSIDDLQSGELNLDSAEIVDGDALLESEDIVLGEDSLESAQNDLESDNNLQSDNDSPDLEEDPDNRCPVNLTLTPVETDIHASSIINISYGLSNESSLEDESVYDLIGDGRIKWYLNGEFIEETPLNSPLDIYSYQSSGKGWYNFTAVFDGNEDLSGASSTLNLYLDPIEVGFNYANATGNTTVDITKSINFYLYFNDDSKLTGERIDIYIDGVWNCTQYTNYYYFKPEAMGVYNITAIYNGTEVYTPCNASCIVTVDKQTTNLTLGGPSQWEIYSDTRIYIDVYNGYYYLAKGTADIYVNGVYNCTINLRNGTFDFVPTSLEEYNITAYFLGDDIYWPSNASKLISFERKTTNISYEEVNASYGSASDIEFNVTSKEGLVDMGLVEVYVNDVLTDSIDLSQSSVFHFTPDAPGIAEIKFKYLENDIYKTSGKVYRCDVAKEPTSINLTYDSIIYYDSSEDIAFNVVTSDGILDEGFVEIYVNDVLNGTVSLNGSNIFQFTPSVVGYNNITLKFLEDELHSSCNETFQILVNKETPKLDVSVNKVTYVNETANFILNLSSNGNQLTGLIDVYVDGNLNATVDLSVSNIFNFAPKKVGNYSIRFAFNGDEHYFPVDKNMSVDFKALPVATKIVASSMTTTAINTKVDGRKGQYFNVTLKDTAGKVLAGKIVQIKLGKSSYKLKTNSKGIARLQVNLAKAATYTLSIVFGGDSDYLKSSKSVKIKVNKQKPKLTSTNKSFKRNLKIKKVTAKLRTSRGKILKGKKLVFRLNRNYTAKTNSKGIATVKVKLTKKGKYTCNVKYGGDSTYKAISKKIRVVIK